MKYIVIAKPEYEPDEPPVIIYMGDSFEDACSEFLSTQGFREPQMFKNLA